MRLLLDTHIWLWMATEPKRLDRKISRRLEASTNELWVSAISLWEAVAAADRRKIDLGADPIGWVERALAADVVKAASITAEIVVEARRIMSWHGDPADRFIVVTARILDMTLVTADERIAGAELVRTLVHP